jgi:hypothetical protein
VRNAEAGLHLSEHLHVCCSKVPHPGGESPTRVQPRSSRAACAAPALCRKLRSDTDSRRQGICLPMSCAGRNWASRPQQSRGSFNRRAFAATANLAVNRGLIADLVQSERPVSLPPPNAPSTSRRQDRRSRRGCHPGKRRSSELAIALSTVARGESVEDRAIGIGPIYEGCELLVSSLALSPSGHIAVSCLS